LVAYLARPGVGRRRRKVSSPGQKTTVVPRSSPIFPSQLTHRRIRQSGPSAAGVRTPSGKGPRCTGRSHTKPSPSRPPRRSRRALALGQHW
jgi:hypothetical protein